MSCLACGYNLRGLDPDGRCPECGTEFAARKVARSVLIGAFVISLFVVALRASPLAWLAGVTETLSGVVSLIGTLAALVYGRQLAQRIPNDSLANQTRIVTWGYGVVLVISLIASAVAIAGVAGGGVRATAGIGILGCFAGLGVVFGIWTLILLIWYRRELNQAAEQARQTWAR